MEFTERMERGRDAAAAKRHRGIVTGKSAAGWNVTRTLDGAETWEGVKAVAVQRWEIARDDALGIYTRLVFPERDFDPFAPSAPAMSLDDVIAAKAAADTAALLATF